MGENVTHLTTPDHLLSGIEAGAAMVFITNPFWLLKTRLQLQGAVGQGNLRYNGPVDAIRTIFREEGVLGFYKGIVPALLLTSHGAVQVWFSSVEQALTRS
jgi:solute carrier family 25 (mitochondrial folate transporter), member 32